MRSLSLDPAAIELAFMAALEPMRTAGTIKTLDAYSGQLAVEDLKHITMQFPAIYVIWGGAELIALQTPDGLHSRTSLIVCASNLRGGTAARHGDGITFGVYELLTAARNILHGLALVSGWYQTKFISEGPLAWVPQSGIAVYEAVYELRRQT